MFVLQISAVETVDAVDYTDLLVNSSTDGRTCPNNKHLFLSKIRLHLRNLVDGTCRKEVRRKLRASEFQVFLSLNLCNFFDEPFNALIRNYVLNFFLGYLQHVHLVNSL